jgi:hypothetical protein
MLAPAWSLDALAALMLAVAAVSAARLAAPRPWRRGTAVISADIAHLLMAAAMAGMLTARLAAIPGTAWEAVSGLAAAWFAWRVWRDARANGVRALAGAHGAPHLLHSGAMLYMLAAPGYPLPALAFALALAGYSAWDLGRISGARAGQGTAGQGTAGQARRGLRRPGPRAILLSCGMTDGCRIAMGVTMAFMLVTMI